MCFLTGFPGVHHKVGHLEGVSLHQTLTEHLDFAGVSDLRLDHHDGDGAVSYVPAVLLDAHQVLPDFSWDEGNA